jgi:hypothetical protein
MTQKSHMDPLDLLKHHSHTRFWQFELLLTTIHTKTFNRDPAYRIRSIFRVRSVEDLSD